ncbi:MAG TPA: hypothetical protein EYP55_00555 [Anaerolineae bacterium]|nr:hypothetical protein [Anaerolineae bacterium]
MKALLGAGASALILLLLFLGYRLLAPPPANPPPPEPSSRKAAIVDQTALSQPNPEFTRKALSYLTEAGFDVDIFKGEEITVEFYRTLPARGYQLIVFRTHSTNDFLEPAPPGEPVYLYTGELHDKYRYTYEQLTQQIMAGKVLYDEEAPQLFIVGPGFVRQSMRGRFDGTLMIIGGCDSLSTPDLAEALVERGASAIVGWNGLVDLSHNDKTILHLLRLLTVERVPLGLAVTRTVLEIGPDPTYKSVLTYYPQRPS